jgi:uncharacterized cupin superfamily protein
VSSDKTKQTVVDPKAVEPRTGSIYPEPFKPVSAGREKQALGNLAGLTQFGVNLTRLKPGAASALRHWHVEEDEFIYVLEGEATLITDAGEQVLGPGIAAGFPAGKADGHHLVNNTGADVLYLEIGSRHPAEEAHYPDVDLQMRRVDGEIRFFHKDGTPY